jgi:hypothetical protein
MQKSISPEQIQSLDTVVKYLYDDEYKHYLENEEPAEHVFTHILELKNLLKNLKQS